MKLYIFLLLLTYQLTLAAQITQQPGTSCKTFDTIIGKPVLKAADNVNFKNAQLISTQKITPPSAQSIITDTASKHINLLLSNTTSKAVRTALSKMGYNISFVNQISGSPQSMPFTSVGNIVLSETNFY